MHSPELEPFLQGIRYGGTFNVVAPKCRVSPLRQDIVQFEEFDDAVPVVVERLIELSRKYVHRTTRSRQTIRNGIHGDLDQHQGGSLERFQETSGETHGDAIVLPEDPSMAGIEVESTSFQIIGRGADIASQSSLG